MNDNTRKTPVTFFYDKQDGGKFTLSIVVENIGVTDRYALKGTVARQLGIVTLDELEHNMPEGVRLSDLFQATVLRVTSLYTGYALRKFHIANELVKYFSEYTITEVPNEYNLPAVKVEETLQFSKAAAEVFDVTCTNMFAVLTHDPEEVAFQESWMDTTSQMMLNAVFDIPKMWTSNINASGVVAHDEHTDWVWNYSPSTEILIIHVHDRTNKKHSQWEVTRDLAIHFTGSDRENGTHYRSFINHEGGRQWHVTRKVVIQRAFIAELPAATTKGVITQIRHLLEEFQSFTLLDVTPSVPALRLTQWITVEALKQAWSDGHGKLPKETTPELARAYVGLVKWRDAFDGNGRWKMVSIDFINGTDRIPDFLLYLYHFINPKSVRYDVLPDHLQQFEAEVIADAVRIREIRHEAPPHLSNQITQVLTGLNDFSIMLNRLLEGK